MYNLRLLERIALLIIFFVVIFFIQTAHAKFNEYDQDFAAEYYLKLVTEGKLPLGNYLNDDGEWKPCHTQDCYVELETNLSKIISRLDKNIHEDYIKFLVLEKEYRSIQSTLSFGYSDIFSSLQKIETDTLDLFKDDPSWLSSFYGNMGASGILIDKNKSKEYSERSLFYFEEALIDEFKKENFGPDDWLNLIEDNTFLFLYAQKAILDYTQSINTLITHSIYDKNSDYLKYKDKLLKLIKTLPKSMMYTFDNAGDFYLHVAGKFEFDAHTVMLNLDKMSEYLNELNEYCIRTKTKREANVLEQAEGTADSCRTINITLAQIAYLNEDKEKGYIYIQEAFKSFEKLNYSEQLSLIGLMINNRVHSILSIKDLYETGLSLGVRTGSSKVDPVFTYWVYDYLTILRYEEGPDKFLTNKNYFELVKVQKNNLINIYETRSATNESFYEFYELNILLLNMMLAEFSYSLFDKDKHIGEIISLLNNKKILAEIKNWEEMALRYDFLLSSAIHYYTIEQINYEMAHKLVDAALQRNNQSVMYNELKGNICTYQGDDACVVKYLKKTNEIILSIAEIERNTANNYISLANLQINNRVLKNSFQIGTREYFLGNNIQARESFFKVIDHILFYTTAPSYDLVNLVHEIINENKQKVATSIAGILRINNLTKNKLSHEEREKLFLATQVIQNSNISKAIIKMTDRMIYADSSLKALYKQKQDLEMEIKRNREELISNADFAKNTNLSNELAKSYNLLKRKLRETNNLLNSKISLTNEINISKGLSLNKLQQLLKNDEVMLIFNRDNEANFSWAVSNTNYLITTLNDSDLERDINSVRNSIDNKIINQNSVFDYVASERLYKSLIKPAENILKNKKKILVLANDDLMTIPLDILPNQTSFNKEKNNWLIKNYSIVNLPNINLIAERQSINNNYNEFNFLGVGDPNLNNSKISSQNLNEIIAKKDFLKNIFRDSKIADISKLDQIPELPETSKELKKISSYFKASNVDLLLRNDARESKIKRLKLEKYNILSFATHTIPDTIDSKLSEPGLLLSLPDKPSLIDDGVLTASEVSQMSLNADLVVLSACNTGQNLDSENDVSGLIDSFIYAGSKAIIASHWPVESNSTVSLMTTTFDNWLELDLSLDIALQRAKLDIMNKIEYAHPMYWASFSIYGGL
ncbi:CHAT domain-containing protein [Pelagibacteraceae bacterium]|nr:CHAT domain-containing protein [Pelagibacteraceae bacterium]